MKSVLGMLFSFTRIPLSQIHTLCIQSWCCLNAWSPSLPGTLNMMPSSNWSRRDFFSALAGKAILLTTAGSPALTILHSLVAAVGYWVDCLTTENLLKFTEKILLVVLDSPGTISTTISKSTTSARPILGLPDSLWLSYAKDSALSFH